MPPLFIKVKAAIEEEVTYFQCLNEEIQANMICNFLGDIFIPPGGGFAFLKVGKVAARNFPNVARAFARLKGILPAAINEEKLLRFMREDERNSPSFQRRLTLAREKYGHVIANSNEAVVFHGSGSASLLTFTSNRSLGGLRPTGELLRQGRAPFTGELSTGTFGGGAGPGINSESLSAVKITDLNLSLDYLGKLGERTQRSRFSFQRREIEESKKALENAQRRGDPLVTSIISHGIKIDEQRAAQWANLSRKDRRLVEENFPVLYGLKPKVSRSVETNFVDLRGGNFGIEVDLNGGADFNEITSVFVPRNKIRLVNSILEENGIRHIRVSPIEPVLNSR